MSPKKRQLPPERGRERSEKPQRGKTFTGCWTCRERRVKCDEQTPHCLRCSRFGVACAGYGVRLTWHVNVGEEPGEQTPSAAAVKHRPSPSRRSFGGAVPSLAPVLSSSEIDGMLERIDECPEGCERSEKGVFSVFGRGRASPVSPGVRSTSDISRPGSPMDHEAPSSFIEGDTEEVGVQRRVGLPGIDSPITSTLTPGVDLGVHQPHQVGVEQHVEATSDWTTDTLPSLPPLPAAFASVGCPQRTFGPQPSPSKHIDLLQMPAAQKRLIHHWVTFTSTKLVLVDEPHNPCRTMMLPMALRGLMSRSDDSSAEIAIFHAICACAAYNLYELGGRVQEQDHAVAIKHDQQAIRHLRHNLAQADQHRDQSFAMAIMACITIEAISGSTRRWRTHVAGGLAYLRKLHSRGVDATMSSAFQKHMVSMAILCGCHVPAELKSFLHGEQCGLELSFPYYGASSSFLRNQDRMNTLAQAPDASELDARELDTLEIQLYLDFPGAALQAGLQEMHAGLLLHIAQAFYYASIVFLQRSVRRLPLAAVQGLVESGVRQLELIESVSRGTAGSIMLWPALVLGAECDTPELQQRVLAWTRAKKKLGFRNVTVLEDLFRALWGMRASGDSSKGWRNLVTEEPFDFFRL